MNLAIDLIYELVMYGKSLFARPLRLRARVWPSTRGIGSTALTLRLVGMEISLCRAL